MRVLVAYMSKTGNTKKVAEAIYGEIDADKEIKRIRDVDSLDGYDLSFLGFPVLKLGPDRKTREFLEDHTKGKKIALFITHATPEDEEALAPQLAKFEEAAAGATIAGRFDCQGQLPSFVKFVMRVFPNPPFREWARKDNSKGQPDAARLERAREFAREIMAKTVEA